MLVEEKGKGDWDTKTHAGKEAVMTGAETGVLLPQAKEYVVPPEAGGGKAAFSLRAFTDRTVLQTS